MRRIKTIAYYFGINLREKFFHHISAEMRNTTMQLCMREYAESCKERCN